MLNSLIVMRMKKHILSLSLLLLLTTAGFCAGQGRVVIDFNKSWKFYSGNQEKAFDVKSDDTFWRVLNLPHDWSIEGTFSKDHPATTGGGALPGGVGWYRKTFKLDKSNASKRIFIDFDGVYMNSEVWINGHYLGKRPNGYISFRYELTPFLNANGSNTIAVKVDNSKQPNSRWYSGSGIYRDVKLVAVNPVYVDLWGTYVTTPKVEKESADVAVATKVVNSSDKVADIKLNTKILDASGKVVAELSSSESLAKGDSKELNHSLNIQNPTLWSTTQPYLYKVISEVYVAGNLMDTYVTPFGVRYFKFDREKGFSLNGKHLKINGVCMHHDLGCLGSAVNKYALERQLRILKEMGCNAIRTSHNPPSSQMLELCDSLGFMVMDEAFDIWKKSKNPYDYHLAWDQWHKRDLEDQIKRDRNHPSVIIWSVGNEIIEQYNADTTGGPILKELVSIVKGLDPTRPTTTANNDISPKNSLINANAADLVGYNYNHAKFESFLTDYPGRTFIATETVSALQSRGHYDMPSDSVRIWPIRWDIPFTSDNSDLTCSAYENCRTPWGSTHEDTWKVLKRHDYLSGGFIWTGFDYIGEPTPYGWPARSSYFGIVDLAGFPKDVYYMYQSEWTDKTVLHLFPHWNWKSGQMVDVWAYYSNADEVELFVNGKSQGVRSKKGEDLHVMWRVPFAAGELKAVSRKGGAIVKTETINTAGEPAKLSLKVEKSSLAADGYDLAYVTVEVTDKDGNVCPKASNMVRFNVAGVGSLVGVDNGCQTYIESLKIPYIMAYNGKCIAVIQNSGEKGKISITASSDGLTASTVEVEVK